MAGHTLALRIDGISVPIQFIAPDANQISLLQDLIIHRELEIQQANGLIRLRCSDSYLEITQTVTGIFAKIPYSEITTKINKSGVTVCSQEKEYVLRCADETIRNKVFYLVSALG